MLLTMVAHQCTAHTSKYLEYTVLGRTRSITASERREWLLFVLLVGPNLLLFGIFTFWPLIYNAYLSFVQWDLLSPIKTWVGLSNYRSMLTDADFRYVLFNTFYFTGASVVVTTVLALALALLLNQPLRGRNGVRTVLFAPVVLSGAAIGIVWIYVFDPSFGVLSTMLGWFGIASPNWLVDPRWAMPAVIIVYVWKNVGYAMVIFIAGLQAIPRELYEAARVDGANAWQRFRNVTLPGLSPVMFFLLLTGVLSSFQAFDIIKTMTNGGPVDATNTLVFYMYEQGFVAFNAGRAGVAAVLLFGIMLAFTLVQMRFAERRVTYG
jgi:multiple sugar transport system permease protein/sn-glycerol 3-phosphate transport system permease protein